MEVFHRYATPVMIIAVWVLSALTAASMSAPVMYAPAMDIQARAHHAR